MRSRVPAALLLVLSWFLPFTGSAHAAQTAVHEAARQQAEHHGHHPGARKSPLPPSTAQARATSHETTGATALLPPGLPRPSTPRAAAAAPLDGAIRAVTGHDTTPARAPPSSTAL